MTTKQKDTKAPTGAVGVSGGRKKPTHVEILLANWDDVCLRVERGELYTDIARHYGVDPTRIAEVNRNYPERAQQYARARQDSADAFEEEIIRTASATDNENYQRNRLLVDTLKWAAARRNFKRYGDKQAVEGDMNLNVIIKKS